MTKTPYDDLVENRFFDPELPRNEIVRLAVDAVTALSTQNQKLWETNTLLGEQIDDLMEELGYRDAANIYQE